TRRPVAGREGDSGRPPGAASSGVVGNGMVGRDESFVAQDDVALATEAGHLEVERHRRGSGHDAPRWPSNRGAAVQGDVIARLVGRAAEVTVDGGCRDGHTGKLRGLSDRLNRSCGQTTGGSMPRALSARTGSQLHTMHAWP